jgi:hypothetical protein
MLAFVTNIAPLMFRLFCSNVYDIGLGFVNRRGARFCFRRYVAAIFRWAHLAKPGASYPTPVLRAGSAPSVGVPAEPGTLERHDSILLGLVLRSSSAAEAPQRLHPTWSTPQRKAKLQMRCAQRKACRMAQLVVLFRLCFCLSESC